MTKIRKEPNRYWSKDDKLRLINELLEGKSSQEVARENDISGGMLRGWIIKFNKEGEQALENKKKPGNPLIKYQKKKYLTNLEKLEYENVKLKIENERLKKLPSEGRWYSCSGRREKVLEFEKVEILSKDFSVKSLCEVMNISKSGYYK